MKELPLDFHLRHYTNYTNTVVFDTINAVPGLKTSAAFFSFLRANLVLPSSTLNSTTSTPLLDPSSSQTLPPLGPSTLATMSSADDAGDEVLLPPNPLEGVPELITKPLTTEDDKISALKLVADSIAQQRNIAASAIIFNPLILALYIGLMAAISQYLYKDRGDIGVVITTGAGVTMACLVAIRSATGGYLTAAEEMTWKWAQNEDGEDDIIIGSRFGDEIMGAAVLRLERSGNGGAKKKKASGKTGGKGLVRAWTVRVKYRGKGVGTELLEEAVRITREKLGNSAEIGFAAEHANSKKVLPNFFNGIFKKKEARAARALEKVVESMDGKKKK
ncbi:uncharacterized protein LY89DRAFT_586297 [Mollisia scopiformis]|uniref:N-acetyltransferase domain-containing protein n=1 Tax=Mollisia scopiformis TaxID=149040 RepID=A0A194X7Y6_MOLSC|nr:uncharacterized protein LY89DRAFT_586297 [Mollisia scopiformis]KUJ16278.1 hypothetical protein LY89DRAFT_586297 [Mollisia scopiformis]